MQTETNLIEDNKRAENHSFLYYLHEEGKFDSSSFSAFCQYLAKIEAISLGQLKDYILFKSRYLNILSGILIVRICIPFLIYRQIMGNI